MMNKWIFLLLLVSCCLASCESQDDLQAEVKMLIENRINERRTSYVTTMERNCEKKVFEEAARIVDSIIIAEARLKKDTVARPPRPDRPDVPELKELKDTMPVVPLFQDSVTVDSINEE